MGTTCRRPPERRGRDAMTLVLVETGLRGPPLIAAAAAG